MFNELFAYGDEESDSSEEVEKNQKEADIDMQELVKPMSRKLENSQTMETKPSQVY